MDLFQALLTGAATAFAPINILYCFIGVLLGTIAANVYRCVDLIFFIPRHVTGLPPMATIRRVIRMGVLFAVAVVPVGLWVPLAPAGWMAWLLQAVLTALWVLLVFGAGNVLMERQNVRETAQRFAGVFRSRIRHKQEGME